MDDRNTIAFRLFRGRKIDLTAANRHLPAGTAMNAAQDFHECRFSCAVLTHDRMDFTRMDIKIDASQRYHVSKGFADPTQRYDWELAVQNAPPKTFFPVSV